MTRSRVILPLIVSSMFALFSSSATAQTRIISTKELQIVVVFTNPDLFAYHSNIGGEITQDLTVTNPPGSTYVFKGGLFLGGTVDLAQDSYTVDRNGIPLSKANSIGTWVCTGTRLVDWNLSGVNFPAEGTFIEEANFSLLLKSVQPSDVNAVYTKGWIVAGQLGFGPDVIVGTTQHAIVGGSGLNVRSQGEFKGEIHLSPDGLASLTTLTFTHPIQIEVPDTP